MNSFALAFEPFYSKIISFGATAIQQAKILSNLRRPQRCRDLKPVMLRRMLYIHPHTYSTQHLPTSELDLLNQKEP
jgi:hypothetical protein